jgi:hypothetical protein
MHLNIPSEAIGSTVAKKESTSFRKKKPKLLRRRRVAQVSHEIQDIVFYLRNVISCGGNATFLISNDTRAALPGAPNPAPPVAP